MFDFLFISEGRSLVKNYFGETGEAALPLNYFLLRGQGPLQEREQPQVQEWPQELPEGLPRPLVGKVGQHHRAEQL